VKRLAIVVVSAVAAVSLIASLGYRHLFEFVLRIPGRDTTAHFAVMGLMAFVVCLGFSSSRLWGRRLGAIGCTLLVAAVVTLEEASQALLPTRAFALRDLLASLAGIALAGLLAALILALRARSR
jgi:VanZ family protein